MYCGASRQWNSCLVVGPRGTRPALAARTTAALTATTAIAPTTLVVAEPTAAATTATAATLATTATSAGATTAASTAVVLAAGRGLDGSAVQQDGAGLAGLQGGGGSGGGLEVQHHEAAAKVLGDEVGDRAERLECGAHVLRSRVPVHVAEHTTAGSRRGSGSGSGAAVRGRGTGAGGAGLSTLLGLGSLRGGRSCLLGERGGVGDRGLYKHAGRGQL